MTTPSNNGSTEPTQAVQVLETPAAPVAGAQTQAPVIGATPPAPTGTPAPQPSPTPDAPPTGPYDLPSDFKAPQPAQSPQGPITDAERQQLDYYRYREQQNTVREQESLLDRYEQQAVQHYITNENYDDQTARLIAKAHRSERAAALQREMAFRAESQASQQVQQDAMAVARQFNVNPAVLAGFTRREDMARHAAVVRHYGDYRKSIEARMAALEKARVPDQQFPGGGSAGTPNLDYLNLLKSGKPLPSAEQIDRMTARYTQG